MLHTEVVAGTTLELLRRLQNAESLRTFCLAGGTSLALYIEGLRSYGFFQLPYVFGGR